VKTFLLTVAFAWCLLNSCSIRSSLIFILLCSSRNEETESIVRRPRGIRPHGKLDANGEYNKGLWKELTRLLSVEGQPAKAVLAPTCVVVLFIRSVFDTVFAMLFISKPLADRSLINTVVQHSTGSKVKCVIWWRKINSRWSYILYKISSLNFSITKVYCKLY
jgi:hypothetical protein